MSKLDQVVFIIDNGQIVETPIRALDGYVEETTTPRGVAPVYHIRENELWSWGHAGNFPRMIRAYDSEAEAIEALEDSFAHDFWNSEVSALAFTTRADAEEFLADNQDD